MEWEKKGHEEKQLDNYLSGVGKATGIPGDTRISNNCLLITDIFPSCLFSNNVRMGALCRPPSLAWPAGPSGRAWFHSSHLAHKLHRFPAPPRVHNHSILCPLGPGCSSLHTPHSSGLRTHHHSPETDDDVKQC